MGRFCDSLEVVRGGPTGAPLARLGVFYSVVDSEASHTEARASTRGDAGANPSAQQNVQTLFVPPLGNSLKLSLIVEFQGKHLTRDSGVVNVLMEMLRKATLFQNLGYTTEVTQGEGPVAIQVSLTDTLFQNASFADLVRFPDEQAKLNRLAFRTLNEIEVKLKTDYYTGDVGARTFVGDLNYLVVTLHAHLEETFPLVFALSARRTYAAAADAAVPQVAKVFAKSPETSVMTEREVLAGVLKAAVQGPSVLGGIRATSSGRLRRMLRDVSRARAEGELPDLEWFKLA